MKSLRTMATHPFFWSLVVPVVAFGFAKAASAPIYGSRILAYALSMAIPGIIAGGLLPVPASGWRALLLLIVPFGALQLSYRFC
ncbi:MAG: hypothetical protein MUF48_04745 [Pirellulaceae bacterium]|jgi:hypothetical protein|nr:hypothetical protein [Pirellulaceae bacterium]